MVEWWATKTATPHTSGLVRGISETPEAQKRKEKKTRTVKEPLNSKATTNHLTNLQLTKSSQYGYTSEGMVSEGGVPPTGARRLWIWLVARMKSAVMVSMV